MNASSTTQTAADPSTANEVKPEQLLAWLQLTNRCNLRCTYCYTESSPVAEGGELPPDLAKQALADFREAGGRTVMLSGGEPTIYAPLEEVLEFACKDLGLNVTLVTNGTHMRPSLVDLLARHSCSVQVSLDAVDRPSYKVMRGNDQLELALAGVSRLMEAGITVTLSSTITTINQSQAVRIVEFAIDRGIQFVHFAPTYWKDGGPFQASLFIKDLYPVLHDLYELQKRNYLLVCIDLVEQLVIPVALGIRRKFYCNAMAGRTVEIASDGSVYACAAQRDVPEMQLGTITADRPLLQIVRDGRKRHAFPSLGADSIEECLSCEYRYICAGGCRAMTYHQAGGLHKRHPNCAELKQLIAEIKQDVESGAIADYVAFLRARHPTEENPDGLLKLF